MPDKIHWTELFRLNLPTQPPQTSVQKPETEQKTKPSAESSINWETLLKGGIGAVPLISNLIQGKGIDSSLGSVLAPIVGSFKPELAPAGQFLGSTIGGLLSGRNIPQAIIGSLPSTGLSLLSTFLPKDLKVIGNIGTPVISAMLNTLTGAPVYGWGTISPALASGLGSLGSIGSALSSILSYSGPIGMILGAAGTVIGDILSSRAEEKAEKKFEKQLIKQARQNEFLKNLSTFLASAIPEEARTKSWKEQLTYLPDWAQLLLSPVGFLYHYPERALKEPQVGLAVSPLLLMYKNLPELTQDLIKRTLETISATSPDFSYWESLHPLQKVLVLETARNILNTTYANMYNLGPTRLEKFLKRVGIPKEKVNEVVLGAFNELAKITKESETFPKTSRLLLEAYVDEPLYNYITSLLRSLQITPEQDIYQQLKPLALEAKINPQALYNLYTLYNPYNPYIAEEITNTP